MDYVLDTSQRAAITLAPATELEEVLQNVRTILTTVQGSVPLDRTFGMRADILDMPLPQAMAVYTGSAAEALARWEPRAEIVSVSWGDDAATAAAAGMDGILKPRVRLRITLTEDANG